MKLRSGTSTNSRDSSTGQSSAKRHKRKAKEKNTEQSEERSVSKTRKELDLRDTPRTGSYDQNYAGLIARSTQETNGFEDVSSLKKYVHPQSRSHGKDEENLL